MFLSMNETKLQYNITYTLVPITQQKPFTAGSRQTCLQNKYQMGVVSDAHI